MNRMYYFLLLPLFFLQCKPDDNLNVAVVMEYPTQTFEISAGLSPLDSYYYIFNDVPTNKSFFFQNIAESDIQAITPGYARITSLESGTTPYEFIEEIVIRICSEAVVDAADATEKCKRELFYRYPVPLKAENTVNLIPNPNVNVKDLLTKETFSFVVVLRRLRGIPPNFIRTRLQMGLEVKR